jgi:hypothetical protein
MRALFSNSWFAGFVEGDGYFAIAIPAASMEKGKGKATNVFGIEQSERRTITGESNKGLMQKIADTFERRLVVVTDQAPAV